MIWMELGMGNMEGGDIIGIGDMDVSRGDRYGCEVRIWFNEIGSRFRNGRCNAL